MPLVPRQTTSSLRALTQRWCAPCVRSGRVADECGSAAVEYVGLGVVVSMLMAAAATAVDSALGEQLVHSLVEKLVASIATIGG